MHRRTFFGVAAAGAASATAVPVPSFELEEIGVTELAEGLRSGRWTSRKLAELYLGRIDAMNHKGPSLGAVIEVNPDALEIADRLDKAAAKSGPMHGIPVLLKDNIDTGDRMSTSAG